MQIGEFDQATIYLDEATALPLPSATPRSRPTPSSRGYSWTQHTTEDLDALRAEVQHETDRWIPLLEEIDAPAALAKAWRMVAFVHGTVCRWQETADALERAIHYARMAGDARQTARLSGSYVMALSEGPTPAPEAIARAEEALRLGLVDRQAQRSCCFSSPRFTRCRGTWPGRESSSLKPARS